MNKKENNFLTHTQTQTHSHQLDSWFCKSVVVVVVVNSTVEICHLLVWLVWWLKFSHQSTENFNMPHFIKVYTVQTHTHTLYIYSYIVHRSIYFVIIVVSYFMYIIFYIHTTRLYYIFVGHSNRVRIFSLTQLYK